MCGMKPLEISSPRRYQVFVVLKCTKHQQAMFFFIQIPGWYMILLDADPMIFRGQTSDFVFQELESEHLTVMPVQSNESHPKELRSTPKLRVATVDGWNLANHLGWSWNPINNGINYLSTGAGFQPSTVCFFFSPKRSFRSLEVLDLLFPQKDIG